MPDLVPERTTPQLSFTLRDAANNIVAAADSCTLTIVTSSGAVVKETTDIKGWLAGGVATGFLTVEDTRMVDASQAKETHIAHVHWTWDSGGKAGRMDIVHVIYNALVPSNAEA
jgi:hypothetical protein